MKIIPCDNCKKLKKVYPSEQIKYKKHFCCHKCLIQWMIKNKNKLFKFGNRHHNWKGNKVGYAGVHAWIKKYLPKTKLCQKCNKVAPRDLANISQKYKRDLEDWEWLCRRCHMKKDGRLKKFIETANIKKLKPKICPECKIYFQPRDYKRKTCSIKCGNKLRVKNMKNNKIKNIKKHREITGKYIHCPRCSEETCYVYLEDNRYRTRCLTCGDNNYLKLI